MWTKFNYLPIVRFLGTLLFLWHCRQINSGFFCKFRQYLPVFHSNSQNIATYSRASHNRLLLFFAYHERSGICGLCPGKTGIRSIKVFELDRTLRHHAGISFSEETGLKLIFSSFSRRLTSNLSSSLQSKFENATMCWRIPMLVASGRALCLSVRILLVGFWNDMARAEITVSIPAYNTLAAATAAKKFGGEAICLNGTPVFHLWAYLCNIVWNHLHRAPILLQINHFYENSLGTSKTLL